MEQQTTTESIRIDKELLDKIRQISKSKGQTISGYISFNLNKQVDRDWVKFENKKDVKSSKV